MPLDPTGFKPDLDPTGFKPDLDPAGFVPDGEPAPRGAIGEIASQLKGGIVADLPKLAGQVLQYPTSPGNPIYELGKRATDYGTERAKQEDVTAHPDEHNMVTNALASGARMMPGVGVALAAGTAAGALAAASPVLAPVATGIGALAGAAPFAMQQGQETYEKGETAGLSEDDAKAAGRINAGIGLAAGAVGNIMGMRMLKGVGNAVSAPTAAGALGQLTDTTIAKPLMKRLGETAVVDTANMAAQAAGQTAVENAYGINQNSPAEAAKESVGPTLGMVAWMSLFGVRGAMRNAGQVKMRNNALSSPEATPETRGIIADAYTTELAKIDPDAAAVFQQNAKQAIDAKLPLAIDESMFTPQPAPGPLTMAAAQATGAKPEPTSMPFKDQGAAQARADAMTRETGTEHEVGPHPEVEGAFAVKPVEKEDGTGTTGADAGKKADVDADVQDAEAGRPVRAGAIGPFDVFGNDVLGEQRAPGKEADRGDALGRAADDGRNTVAGPLEEAAKRAPVEPKAPVEEAAKVEEAKPEDRPYTNIGADSLSSISMTTPLDIAAHEAASSPMNERKTPTEPQQDANNTMLGKSEYQGVPLRFENSQGSTRQSKEAETPAWKTLMTVHYGYFPKTKGADGGGVDFSLKPGVDPNAVKPVFVIDQTRPDGKFDEHKVQLGFDTKEEAQKSYYDNYQAGWKGGEAIHETTVDGLKSWLKDGDKSKPFAESGLVTPEGSRSALPEEHPAAAQSSTAAEPVRPADLSASPSPTESLHEPASAPSEKLPQTELRAESVEGSRLSENQQPPEGARPSGAEESGSSRSPNKEFDAENTAKTPASITDAAANSAKVSEKLQEQAVALQQNIKAEKPNSPRRNRMEAQLDDISERIKLAEKREADQPKVDQAVKDEVIPAEKATEVPAFTNHLEAARFARENDLDAVPVTHDDGSVVLQPKPKNVSLADRKEANAQVEKLNVALKPEGVRVAPVHDVTPFQKAIQTIVHKAFGTDLIYVSDNNVFHGVALDGRVYVTRGEKAPLISTVFHEVMHTMQQLNPELAAKLHDYVRSYMNGGLVEGRIQKEFEAATRSAPEGTTVERLSHEEGFKEAMADINGAAALDPKFWQKMAEYDPNLFRKVAYKFMELMTKAIEVAKGTHYDLDAMVKDRETVQHLIAATWAEYNTGRKGDGTNEGQFSRKDGSDEAAAKRLQERAGVRGGVRVLDEPSGQNPRLEPLKGLPATVTVDGKQVTFGPHAPAREAAQRYMEKAGLPYKPLTEYVKVDPGRAKRIAEEFDAMRHDPQNPEVKASYDAMIKETLAQFQEIKATGLKVEFIDFDKQGDPYGNPRNAILDVTKNNHLWVFSTKDGFGSDKLDVRDNPLLAETGEKISGQTALANDIFRVVHDYFGHIKEGVGFRADGEENAWQQHSRMYSKDAIPAMTSETRGQNSWVNFGPYAESNKTASGADTHYAPQKVGIMPEWTRNDGKAAFARRVEHVTNAEAATEVARSTDFKTNRDFKMALQERALKAAKEAKTDLNDPEYLHKVIVKDAMSALETNKNAVGWYDDKLTKALNVASLSHPEVTTDRQAKFGYTWALAATSNGMKVDKNFELADRAYEYSKTHDGHMPTDIGIGTSAERINKSMEVYNHFLDTWGFEATEKFMTQLNTVRDIAKATGIKPSGEGMDTMVYGASVIGPKVGNGYFANLYGHYEQLTMDRWFMRSWGRWTGSLVSVDKELIKQNGERIRDVVGRMDAEEKKTFQMLIQTKLSGSPAAIAEAIGEASKKPAIRERMNALPNGSELRMAGNMMYKHIDGQVEAPRNASQRAEIRSIMKGVLEEMQHQHPDLTMADLQALLWYPEKRLYDTAKISDTAAGYDDAAAPDYANAAARWARTKGVPEADIQAALRRNENGSDTGQRTGPARRDAGQLASAQGRQFERAGLDEPSDRPGAARVRPDDAVSIRPQREDALPAQAVVHYGKVGDLGTLDASRYGEGIKGAEAARLKYSDDASIKSRVYFYLKPEDGSQPKKEGGLGPHVYEAQLSNLYDLANDPAGILSKVKDIADKDDRLNAMESEIVKAGYDGYAVKPYNMAVALGVNVPVKYTGNEVTDRSQFDRKPPGADDKNKVGDYHAYLGIERKIMESKTTFMDGIKRALLPASRDGSSEQAGIMRANFGQQAHEREVAQVKLMEFAKHFDKTPIDTVNYPFIDAMERGQPIVGNPKLQAAATALREALDYRRDQVIALGKGALENFNANYFPHIWEDPAKASNFFSRRPLQGGKGFLKQRTYDFFMDGIDAGLVPVTTNPVELAMLKMREMDRYIYGQKIFAEMKDAGIAKFVSFGGKAPDGWVKLNDSIARVIQHSDLENGMIMRGEYYAPDAAATLFTTHLPPGLSGMPAYDLMRKAGNMMNAAQLGLSAFHLGFTTLDAMISKAALGIKQVTRGDVVKGVGSMLQSLNPAQPVLNLMKGDKLLKAYLGDLTDPSMAPIVEALTQAGGRVKMDDVYRNAAVNEFTQALRKGDYKGVAMAALPRMMDLINKPIFEYLVPRQKLGVFVDMAKDALEANPTMDLKTKREVMGKLWDSVDNRMGELVYDNVFWNRALKDSLMIATRSVGWNLGTFREIGGGVADLTKIKQLGSFSDRTAYIFGLMFMTSIIGSMTQYLYTGSGPDELKDVFFPKTGKTRPDGTVDRLSLPSYMKDIAEYGHDIRGFVKYGDNPFNTVANKVHPLLATMGELISNKDFFGGAIRSPGDAPMTQVLDTAKFMLGQMTPFSLRNYQQQAKLNKEEPSIAGYMSSPQMIGISPAPGYMTKNDAQAENSQVGKMRDSLITKFKEEIRDGAAAPMIVKRALSAGLGQQDIQYILRSAVITPPRRIKSFGDGQ